MIQNPAHVKFVCGKESGFPAILLYQLRTVQLQAERKDNLKGKEVLIPLFFFVILSYIKFEIRVQYE